MHGEFERNDMVQHFGEQLSGRLHPTRLGVQVIAPPPAHSHLHRRIAA
ncbi:hypothetical protein [Mesorhizobium sp. WSM3873]